MTEIVPSIGRDVVLQDDDAPGPEQRNGTARG